jgi:hypothetical protein
MGLTLRGQTKQEFKRYVRDFIPFPRRYENGERKGQIIFNRSLVKGTKLIKQGYKNITFKGEEQEINPKSAYLVDTEPVMVDPYTWMLKFMEKDGIWESNFEQAMINATKAYDAELQAVMELMAKQETK